MLLGYIHSFWLLLQTWIKNLAFKLFCYGSGEALYDFMNLVITHFLVFAASFFAVGGDTAFFSCALHFEEVAPKARDHTISPYSLTVLLINVIAMSRLEIVVELVLWASISPLNDVGENGGGAKKLSFCILWSWLISRGFFMVSLFSLADSRFVKMIISDDRQMCCLWPF